MSDPCKIGLNVIRGMRAASGAAAGPAIFHGAAAILSYPKESQLHNDNSKRFVSPFQGFWLLLRSTFGSGTESGKRPVCHRNQWEWRRINKRGETCDEEGGVDNHPRALSPNRPIAEWVGGGGFGG